MNVSLDQIIITATKITKITGSLACQIAEQSSVPSNINVNVDRVDELSQSLLGNATSTTDLCGDLKNLNEALNLQVSTFKI